MARNTKSRVKDIPLIGRLITSTDGAFIGEHFKVITNLRYNNFGLEGVGGMSKINTTALSSYPKMRSGFHFKKDKPSESHVLVQAWNSALSSSVVYKNDTAIPSAGDFTATALYTDTSGAGTGSFGTAPNGEVCYCNGNETLIWGGDEFNLSKFINYDPAGAFRYDFTQEVSNDLDDSNNIATLEGQDGGNTSDVVLLLNLDNNITDTSVGGSTHTVTNNNVTFSAGVKALGTHSAVFNGTTSELTIPDHTDFDFSQASPWTFDFRVRVNSLASINPIIYQEMEMSSVPYNSGSVEPSIGDTLTGAVSGETLIVHNITLTSGTWAGGNAVGVIWSSAADISGAFNNNEQLDNTTTAAGNVASTNGATNLTAGEDYAVVRINTNGSVELYKYENYSAGSDLDLVSVSGVISTDTWYHIMISHNGNDWFLFVDGAVKGYISSANHLENYTSTLCLGCDETNFLDGYLDELRVSSIAQQTANFEIPTTAYTSSSSISYMYIGALKPLQGFKYYMKTVNTSSSTMVVEYWDGDSWESVTTLADGTSSGGASLAQTGSVTFDSTSTIARASIIDQTYVFWYRVTVDDVDTGTSIKQVTTNEPMQKLQDIWDGNFRSCLKFYKWTGTTYNDGSTNIFSENYSSADTATYAQVGATTSSQYLLSGFPERISALNITLVDSKVNSNASVLDIKYWNGSSWISVTGLSDGTISSGKSLAKTGNISWQSPSKSSEFKQEISKEIPLYYYKITFSATLSADVYIDHLSGTPAQLEVKGHKFSMNAQDRLWLCSETSNAKNTATCSARGTSVVFNGEDSVPIVFGDSTELTAATNLYSQFGSSLYDLMVFCKRHETWIVSGTTPQSWVKYRASDKIGCVAPLTMTKAHVGFETVGGLNRYIAIWQSNNGIHMFDGRNFHPIHADINDLFDPKKSTSLNLSVAHKSVGYYDETYGEYHWLCATGTSTTLNKEFVYDLSKKRWYNIDRGSGKYLQTVIPVQDTSGNKYNYGCIDTGYMERLESGTTFDGDDMVHTFQIGELGLVENFSSEGILRGVRLVGRVKNTTSNTVTLDYYVDSSSTAKKSFTNLPVSGSGKTVTYSKKDLGSGYFVNHSLKFSLTTNDETYGFEPYVVSLVYDTKGLDIS